MSTGVRISRAAVAAAATALLVLTGCSDPTPSTSTPSQPPTPAGTATPGAATSAPPTPAASATPSARVTNDLANNKLSRSLTADPLTASVDYSTSLPVNQWAPQGTKPLRVALTAVNNSTRGQKIYLSRVTASVSSYDASGLVDGPRAITDTANISPGYYVTFPTEYGQTLLLPAVDPASIRLTVDFTYEFVAQVSGEKSGTQRDFAKQTATDRLTIPLS